MIILIVYKEYIKGMFNVLGQSILPPVKEAEKTDTHQYIRRHERDSNSKNKKKKQSDDLFDTEDKASVSVDALYSFLHGLTQDGQNTGNPDDFISSKERTARDILEEGISITAQRTKTTSENAHAAHAYAHAAETSPKAEIRSNSYNSHNEDSALTLNDEDMRIVQDLLGDLKILQAHNIREIEIERAETLFQSLQKSVKAHKDYISSL